MSSKTNILSNTIYCKGKLLGYSEPGRKSLTIGKINFSEFSWKYIRIDDVKVIDQYNSEELKVGDFWYKKVLKGRKNWFFSRQFELKWPISFSKKFPFVAIHFDCIRWPKRPEIFIPRGDSEFSTVPYTKSSFQISKSVTKGVRLIPQFIYMQKFISK